VQNWDKTLTIIPTHNFLGKSFKNWRGMQASGGRRIKRSLDIDMSTVHFLDEADVERLSRFVLLQPYFEEKRADITAWIEEHPAAHDDVVNSRRLTNIGTFRAYVTRYLRAHPGIAQDMTFLVRHLQPGPRGLPLEIYVFVNDVRWAVYEGVQADVFDHLIAILPEFGLRLFQEPSGSDMRAFAVAARA
jgi:miniconductance mechanosensitive channel